MINMRALPGSFGGDAFEQMVNVGSMPYGIQVGTAMGEAMVSSAELETSLVKMQNDQMKEQLKRTRRKSDDDAKSDRIKYINELLEDDSVDDQAKAKARARKMELYSELIGVDL